MIKYLTIYDNTKTYLFPNMTQATPDIVAMQYSAVNTGSPCVIETDASGIMFYTSPEPIAVIKSRYDIDSSLSDEDAITVIEDILNAPDPVVEYEPTAEDRIAAALEYQNLLSI